MHRVTVHGAGLAQSTVVKGAKIPSSTGSPDVHARVRAGWVAVPVELFKAETAGVLLMNLTDGALQLGPCCVGCRFVHLHRLGQVVHRQLHRVTEVSVCPEEVGGCALCLLGGGLRPVRRVKIEQQIRKQRIYTHRDCAYDYSQTHQGQSDAACSMADQPPEREDGEFDSGSVTLTHAQHITRRA